MTYRSLLVLLDQDPLCPARTQVAIELARRHDCHLVGVAPTGLIDLPMSAEVVVAQAEFSALAWDALRDQAERATDRFRDACRAGGIKSFEAVIDEAEKAPSLVRHAHCSDLTILSQADPGNPGRRLDQGLVEQVVLYSARPTLVLPYAGRFETLGTNVMVAWDDSREAARALSDALPLLRTAGSVQVVCWNESDSGTDDKAMRSRLAAVCQWLMWQGVSAEARVETTLVGVADAMLSRAADLGTDLIVMGAYGHSRLTERMLGGATRGLLRSMTVPVLMSH
jgi:nucleotide-binding universal stress UspA family protein